MGDDRLPSSAISGTRVGKYLLGRFISKNHSSKVRMMPRLSVLVGFVIQFEI